MQARVVSKESRKLQDRLFDVERFMKSMRLLQLTKSGSIEEDDEGETEFNDVSLHLYRQTVPDFDERKKFLEQKLIVRAILQFCYIWTVFMTVLITCL